MSAVPRGLVGLAVLLSPVASRRARDEQWRADLLGGPALGVSPWRVATGALVTALTTRWETATRRTRAAAVGALAVVVLVVAGGPVVSAWTHPGCAGADPAMLALVRGAIEFEGTMAVPDGAGASTVGAGDTQTLRAALLDRGQRAIAGLFTGAAADRERSKLASVVAATDPGDVEVRPLGAGVSELTCRSVRTSGDGVHVAVRAVTWAEIALTSPGGSGTERPTNAILVDATVVEVGGAPRISSWTQGYDPCCGP